MKIYLRNIIFSLIALFTIAPLVYASPIAPFKTRYTVTYLGLTVGITRQIFTLDAQHHYRFIQIAEATVPGISFHTEEISEGVWRGDTIQPLRYSFRKEGTALATVKSVFDWPHHRVFYEQKGMSGVKPLPVGALDKLSCQLALRQALTNGLKHYECPFMDGRKYKHYFFNVIGKKTISTSLGQFDALEIEQRKPGASKPSSLFWVVPEENFLLIKFSYLKDKKSPSTAVIKHFSK